MDRYLGLLHLRENVYRAEADFWRASKAYFVELENEELCQKAYQSGENYAAALIEIQAYLNNVPPDIEIEKELNLMRRFSTILKREMELINRAYQDNYGT